ncbi:serine/threonine-protein kinase ULK4-like [Halichondria panicea]|uniref:serine/threonine-protein kinase ULK4-like n=1 Tax=Halichondria panicea TaxID=6063 RepID=UPI00312B6B2E
MENYLLCGELQSQEEGVSAWPTPVSLVYKGRRKGSVQFVGIGKYDKQDKKYIENGVQLMHSLDHENVLKFSEWYETPQHIWVITELAIGGTLSHILHQDGCIPSPNIHDFVRDIAAGLTYIHSRGVLYCDLQPSKIVLDGRQLLKLSDFTLAKTMADCHNHYNLTSLVHTLLTPSGKDRPLKYAPSPFYAAPELFVDGGQFSPASDLWSLGCIVYELSLGCKPFDSNDPDLLLQSISCIQPNAVVQSPETAQLLSNLLTGEPSHRTTPPQYT